MSCAYPLAAYQVAGERKLVFREKRGADYVRAFFLPCGRCAGCLLERSRQWAVRCMHEAKLHKENSFITLTYADEHLPEHSSLRYEDYQKFMKRLIKRLGPTRFYMCGEYGEQTQRPHYHACLFGCGFPDKLYFKKTKDFTLYTSKVLGELWPLGTHLIGAVTFESAAYVARYCMEKVSGPEAAGWYSVFDAESGEVTGVRVSEFSRMSNRPGIGAGWFNRYYTDFAKGEVLVNGRKAKSPRYYDVLLERRDPDQFEQVKYARYAKSQTIPREEKEDARLQVHEAVRIAKFSRLMRSTI